MASLAHMLFDMIYPPRCPSCRDYVAADGNFCSPCFDKLHLITAPMCVVCGIPFELTIEDDAQCPLCLEASPSYDTARAVMVYDAISAPLVSTLKFNDQWAGLRRHAAMMSAVGSDSLKGADLLIPVPLHWRRLLGRRFNQSALLAFTLSQMTSIPCDAQVLVRIKHTTPQMRLKRKERLTNVKKAFALISGEEHRLAGKRVVLVDDVITTGATAEACALILKKAGAVRVDVLALARTVKR